MAGFRVIIQPEAELNIASTHAWLAERSVEGADRWYVALCRAIDQLRIDPGRFPIAVESRRFDTEVRNLTFRMRSGRRYRLLFTVVDDTVHILYLRGPGRDWVAP